MDDEIGRAIFELDLFEGLGEAMRATMIREVRPVDLKAGDILFNQGDPAQMFFYTVKGWITVYRLQKSGARVMLHVFGAGELFAEAAALAIGQYPASAEAATKATVFAIAADTYRRLVEHDPAFAMRVIGRLAQRMRLLIDEFESSQNQPGPSRLAAFLLELAEQGPGDGGRYPLPFSKQVLAARLRMQPESLSRAFADLRSLGVQTSRDGSVLISEPESLRQLVGE